VNNTTTQEIITMFFEQNTQLTVLSFNTTTQEITKGHFFDWKNY